jgi:mannose-6-phosphate isomerase-like protein (cupin superfamily)
MPSSKRAHLAATQAIAHLPELPEEQYAILFRHGTLTVGIYAPRGTDPQQPHSRDEAYVVVQGQGTYVNGDTRRAFTAGDLIFVPAHVPHHFEDFTDDFVVWVLFYGPEGGEAA